MLKGMVEESEEALLLFDTCGESASVALVRKGAPSREIVLEERTASTALLGAVRRLLAEGHVGLGQMTGVGVVNGPGSFTGVRVGLSLAKGLCEASDLAFAAVSRLAVLAESAGLEEGFAVLRAGRDEVFVREERRGRSACERMVSMDSFPKLSAGSPVIYTEAALEGRLGELAEARFVGISALSSVGAVRRGLAEGGTDLSLADANYLRDEGAIYARQRLGG